MVLRFRCWAGWGCAVALAAAPRKGAAEAAGGNREEWITEHEALLPCAGRRRAPAIGLGLFCREDTAAEIHVHHLPAVAGKGYYECWY